MLFRRLRAEKVAPAGQPKWSISPLPPFSKGGWEDFLPTMTNFILTNPAKRGISFSLALSAYNIEIRNNIKYRIFKKRRFLQKSLTPSFRRKPSRQGGTESFESRLRRDWIPGRASPCTPCGAGLRSPGMTISPCFQEFCKSLKDFCFIILVIWNCFEFGKSKLKYALLRSLKDPP
jgi:hypothetical protein